MTTRAGVATLLGIGDRLFGVVAITANDAWTVGAMLNRISSRLEQPLIEHWDGRRWSVTPSPIPPADGDYYLDGVAADTPNDTYAGHHRGRSAAAAGRPVRQQGRLADRLGRPTGGGGRLHWARDEGRRTGGPTSVTTPLRAARRSAARTARRRGGRGRCCLCPRAARARARTGQSPPACRPGPNAPSGLGTGAASLGRS